MDSQDHFCKCPQLGDEWRIAIRRALDRTVAVELPTFWSSPAPAAGPHLKPKILGALAEFLQHRDSHYTRRCGFFLAAKANDVIKKLYINERVAEVPPDTTAFFKNLRLELVRSASVLFSNRMVRMEALGRIR